MSSECDNGAYCTFHGTNTGTCEKCTMLKNKQCKDAVFIDVEDEEECKAECEGQ